MAEMGFEHAEQARQALRAIVSDPGYGMAALSAAPALANLLKDYLPDAPRERAILVAAAEAGLAGLLRDHVGRGMDLGTAIRVTASGFASVTPFTPEACAWAAGEIARAMGISPDQPVPESGSEEAGAGLAGGPAGPPEHEPTRFAHWPGRQVPGGAGAGGPGEPAAARWPGHQADPEPAGQPVQAQAPQYLANPVPGQPGGQQARAGQPEGQAAQDQTRRAGATPYPAAGGPPARSRRRPWPWILSAAGALIVLIVVASAAWSAGAGQGRRIAGGGAHHTPPLSPPPATPAGASTPLWSIMNPQGFPVQAASCQPARLHGLQHVTAHLSCQSHDSGGNGFTYAGYQFDNAADFRVGYADILAYVGFSPSAAGSNVCSDATTSPGQSTWWNAGLYPKVKGQEVQCEIWHRRGAALPLLVWSLPTQHVVLAADTSAPGANIHTVFNWWYALHLG